MSLELDVENRQASKDNELIKELIQARDMNLTKHKKIKDAVEKDEKYAGFPVINLENRNINEIQAIHEKTVKELVGNPNKLRAFGTAAIHTINYDGSYAANLDRVNSKAKREGIESPKEKEIVRRVTIDHTQVYRNSTDVEKDMGISRESMYRVDTPDRSMVDNVMRDVVVAPVRSIDDYISEKYSKWNDRADREREEREKELALQERERLNRETREEVEYDYFPSILGR